MRDLSFPVGLSFTPPPGGPPSAICPIVDPGLRATSQGRTTGCFTISFEITGYPQSLGDPPGQKIEQLTNNPMEVRRLTFLEGTYKELADVTLSLEGER